MVYKEMFIMTLLILGGISFFGYFFFMPMADYASWLAIRERGHLPTTGTYTGTLSICKVEHPQSGGTTYLTFTDGSQFIMSGIYELQSGQHYTVTYNLYNNYATEVKLAQ